MKTTKVCLLGGTGFIGRHLVNRLSAEGIRCKVLTRRPHRHRQVGVAPGTSLVEARSLDAAALAAHFADVDAVVNLVGILSETGGATFERAHFELPKAVLEACRAAGVPRLLHMSALNADAKRGPSEYLRTKGRAEDHVHAHAGPVAVTSFRPSVIFGPDDSFFNRFAALLRIPGPFPLACPSARFAPVYVGDVTEAFARALDDPATHDRRYELCGPRVFTLRELVEYTAAAMDLTKPIVGLALHDGQLPVDAGGQRLRARRAGDARHHADRRRCDHPARAGRTAPETAAGRAAPNALIARHAGRRSA